MIISILFFQNKFHYNRFFISPVSHAEIFRISGEIDLLERIHPPVNSASTPDALRRFHACFVTDKGFESLSYIQIIQGGLIYRANKFNAFSFISGFAW